MDYKVIITTEIYVRANSKAEAIREAKCEIGAEPDFVKDVKVEEL